MSDVSSLFRLNIEVGDLESCISFYSKLLGITGRKQAGSVLLQVWPCDPASPRRIVGKRPAAPSSKSAVLYSEGS